MRYHRPRDGQSLLLCVFWSNRDSTSTSAGSAVLPGAEIHRGSGLWQLSRLYCPFKVPHATIAYTAVLWRGKRVKGRISRKGSCSMILCRISQLDSGINGTNGNSRPAWSVPSVFGPQPLTPFSAHRGLKSEELQINLLYKHKIEKLNSCPGWRCFINSVTIYTALDVYNNKEHKVTHQLSVFQKKKKLSVFQCLCNTVFGASIHKSI